MSVPQPGAGPAGDDAPHGDGVDRAPSNGAPVAQPSVGDDTAALDPATDDAAQPGTERNDAAPSGAAQDGVSASGAAQDDPRPSGEQHGATPPGPPAGVVPVGAARTGPEPRAGGSDPSAPASAAGIAGRRQARRNQRAEAAGRPPAAEVPGPGPVLPPAPDPLLPVGPKRNVGWARVAGAAALFLVVVSLPLWVGQAAAGFVVDVTVLVALAQWWGLLAGFAGTPSLAGGLYAGAGAYGWLALVQWGGLNPVVAVAVAAVGVGVLAAPTGWLLLRLAPAWTALAGLVVTAAASQLVAVVDSPSVTGRTVTSVASLSPTLRRSLTTWLAVVLGVGSVAAAVAVRRSRLGLAVVADRDDPEAASTLGVRANGARTWIWTMAAVAAGMAGAALSLRSGTVVVGEAFDPIRWVLPAVVAAALGGVRSLSGPAIGAVAYVIAERVLHAPAALLICAVAAAVLMVYVPRGLAEHAVPALHRRAEPWLARLRAIRQAPRSGTTTAAPP